MGCCSLRTEPSAKPWCVRRFPGVLAVPGPSHGPLAVQGEAAPGLTLIALLTIMMASCSDRSVSSMNCSAPPRRMMVQVLALGQPVKKLYLEKGGFGDGEAAAGQAVWGHSQPSSSVPLTAPADPRLRRSRARECRSEIPADPGKSTLFLLPGIHAELELPICTWQEHGGQQPAPNRIAPPATGRTPVYCPQLLLPYREVSHWNITEVPQSTPQCAAFLLQMQQYHCAFYKALQNTHVFLKEFKRG